jgi:hypothetical protein
LLPDREAFARMRSTLDILSGVVELRRAETCPCATGRDNAPVIDNRSE